MIITFQHSTSITFYPSRLGAFWTSRGHSSGHSGGHSVVTVVVTVTVTVMVTGVFLSLPPGYALLL